MNLLKKRLLAFQYAINGLVSAFKNDMPLKIHSIATIIVILFAWFFDISRVEWMFIILACALVILSELFNTSIERLCDTIHPDKSENIKFVKDVSAGAVLVALIFAIVVFVFVFIYKHQH